MECLRCAGLMVSEQFYDFLDDRGNDFKGYRCLVCGEILDPIIAKNKWTKNEEQNDPILSSGVMPILLQSAVETD